MDKEIISEIKARQVLDSRGNPTVEADVVLKSGEMGRAIVPSGASTGKREALELRDGYKNYYGGKGVLKAVWNINGKIRDLLVENTAEQNVVDTMMCEMDGTPDKSRLGANAILAVSLATAKAVAATRKIPFYKYVASLAGTDEKMSLPMPMMNVMNGGAHAGWSTDFQEYMIVPIGGDSMADAIRMGAEVFHNLKKLLDKNGYPTTVGDEGGFAPKMQEGNEEPLDYIMKAIKKSGYEPGVDFGIALDVAASEFCDLNTTILEFSGEGEHSTLETSGKGYRLKTNKETRTTAEMIDWYKRLAIKYPLLSIEDGLSEDDWSGWRTLTEKLGQKVQLVGDDLFVTNTELLERGIREKVGNAILIKPNQIGTLSETIAAVKMAKKNGYQTVISHRSGDSEDTTIAHLAVGLGARQIKTGSLSRSERIAKYNELIRIEEENRHLNLSQPFAK